MLRFELLTSLLGSINWFVGLYKHHSVFVAQKNLGFLVKRKVSII